MKKYDSHDNVNIILGQQDLEKLVQQGRRLHDQVVFDTFGYLVSEVCALVKKCFSASPAKHKVECPDHREASLH